jgi:hypothetical protein
LRWWREDRLREDIGLERLGRPPSVWGSAVSEEIDRLEKDASAN